MNWNKILLIAFALLLATTAGAQPWTEALNELDHRPTAQERIDAFDAYWADKTPGKGTGFKQFMRWRNFVEPRLNEDGYFDPIALWRAWEMKQQVYPSNELDEANWTPQGPFAPNVGSYVGGLGRINCIAFDPNNANHIFAGAASGGLWETYTGGFSWVPRTDHLPVLGVADIVIDHTDSDIMYFASGDADAADTYSVGVFKSTDAGQTWNPTQLSFDVVEGQRMGRLIMHPDDHETLIVTTTNGLYKTTSGGVFWYHTFNPGGFAHDMEVKIGDANTWFASVTGDGIYRSTDAGETWSEMTNGLPGGGFGRIAIAVSPSDPNRLYALYSGTDSGFYGVYSSSNGGNSWTLKVDSPNMLGWNTDGSGTGGQGWYDLTLKVDPLNANTLYLGGVNVWKSVDGGSSWDCTGLWWYDGSTPYVHADHHRMEWFGLSTLYDANDGGLYRTMDGGENWLEISHGMVVQQSYRLGVSQSHPDATAWMIGNQDNGTKFSLDGEVTPVLGGDGMECAINPLNPDYMYGESQNGGLNRSTNGGLNWQNATNGIVGDPAWVMPYVIDPVSPHIMYLGTNYVNKSTDAGASWFGVSPSAGGSYYDRMSAMAIAPSDHHTVYAVNPNGDCLVTNDGGSTWDIHNVPASPLTYVAVHPTDPNTVYVTVGGYNSSSKFYVSNDGGASWNNISFLIPNLPINCVLIHPDNANHIYLGTDVGVLFSNDGGFNWMDWNDGLPNVIIMEMELHRTTNTIVAASYGRGVWSSPAEGAVPDPVTLTLTPLVTVIPPGGGTLNYEAALVSTLPGTYNGVDYWTMITLPNNNVVGPTFQAQFVLTPFMDVEVSLSQDIPDYAPVGTYTFTGNLGWYPTPTLTDEFTFSKSGVAANAGEYSEDPSQWASYGEWPDADPAVAVANELPSEFSLSQAWPNPFNPTTMISVALPEASDLNVTVFNVTGQQVAELANGQFSAGQRNLTFDASNLASGLYFVRATVPGQLDQTQKMMLVR
jgi:photosystem II stability/assembly factor-like uncharacterized protein